MLHFALIVTFCGVTYVDNQVLRWSHNSVLSFCCCSLIVATRNRAVEKSKGGVYLFSRNIPVMVSSHGHIEMVVLSQMGT